MSQRTVAAALRAGAGVLTAAGVEGAARDARLLMAHVLGLEAARMTLHLQDEITPEAQAAFEALVAERAARRPVAQLTGRRQFYGRIFEVTPDVLDPRGDTETLIAAALAEPFAHLLDLGTGSGCIALTLLAESDAQGLATDISEAALAVAARNAAALGVAARVRLRRSDWFEAVEGRFDLIVSNPPYIALGDMAGLAPELAFEPRGALTDEADGLTAYRVIAAQAADYLDPGGRLMLEVGAGQAADVQELLRLADYCDVQHLHDLDGHERVVWGRKPA